MVAKLYEIMGWVAKIHSYILSWNDANEASFTDKELHFLVIGFMGLAMVCVVQPIFKWLAKNGHVLVITWIYVFSMILVITFAIEIGQKLTHTGVMEFEDIMFGVVGFFVIFMIYPIVRGILRAIVYIFTSLSKGKK